jgi:hypothetical protein
MTTKGLKYSPESCARISAALLKSAKVKAAALKRPSRSLEHCANLSAAMKGKRHSPAAIAKMRTNRNLGGLSATYRSWESMKARCLNPNATSYRFYGGRDPPVKICKRWLKFENFLAYVIATIGLRPKGKSLDRYPDKDGDYKPGNIRWATPKEQANNRKPYPKGFKQSPERCAKTRAGRLAYLARTNAFERRMNYHD